MDIHCLTDDVVGVGYNHEYMSKGLDGAGAGTAEQQWVDAEHVFKEDCAAAGVELPVMPHDVRWHVL